MADKEALLRLRLAASNEASPAFKEVSESMASLRTIAQDAAKSVSSEIASITKHLTDMAKTFQTSAGDSDKDMRGMETTTKQAAGGIEQSMSQLRSAIDSVSRVAGDMTKSLSSATGQGGKDFGSLSRNAKEATTSVSQSLSETSGVASKFDRALSDIAKTSFRTREELVADFAGIRQSFGNESLAATEASQLTTAQLRRIVSSAQQTSVQVVRSLDEAGAGFKKPGQAAHDSSLGALIAVQMLGQSMEHIGSMGEHLFGYAIEQGADFQQSVKNIQVVIAAASDKHQTWNQKMRDASGLSTELQNKALELGSRGAQSANEVAAAIDTMLRSGVSAKAVLGGAAEAAQNVSIVTKDSLDESASLITEVYHQFREEFAHNGKSVQENMKQTGDVISGVLLSANIDTNDFLNTLKYVGPVASQLGSGLDDAATAAALLAQNGIKGLTISGPSHSNVRRKLGEFRESRNVKTTAILSQAA